MGMSKLKKWTFQILGIGLIKVRLNKTKPRPYLSEMSVVRVQRGQKTLAYKTDFSSSNIQLNFLTGKAMTDAGTSQAVVGH